MLEPAGGLAWYRADVSYWFFLLLQRIGLAWDVIVPRREQIAARYSPSPTANGLATE
jgi:fatty-acid desaturase